MTMPGTLAKHRRLLTTALAASAVAAVVLTTSRFPDPVGAGSPGAAAATATALVPAHAWVARQAETPRPRIDPAAGRSGVILYLLMEAARPQPLFTR